MRFWKTAMWMPILFLLIVGMIQFGKLTYLDYVLNKIVYSAARNLAAGQNLNFLRSGGCQHGGGDHGGDQRSGD